MQRQLHEESPRSSLCAGVFPAMERSRAGLPGEAGRNALSHPTVCNAAERCQKACSNHKAAGKCHRFEDSQMPVGSDSFGQNLNEMSQNVGTDLGGERCEA